METVTETPRRRWRSLAKNLELETAEHNVLPRAKMLTKKNTVGYGKLRPGLTPSECENLDEDDLPKKIPKLVLPPIDKINSDCSKVPGPSSCDVKDLPGPAQNRTVQEVVASKSGPESMVIFSEGMSYFSTGLRDSTNSVPEQSNAGMDSQNDASQSDKSGLEGDHLVSEEIIPSQTLLLEGECSAKTVPDQTNSEKDNKNDPIQRDKSGPESDLFVSKDVTPSEILLSKSGTESEFMWSEVVGHSMISSEGPTKHVLAQTKFEKDSPRKANQTDESLSSVSKSPGGSESISEGDPLVTAQVLTSDTVLSISGTGCTLNCSERTDHSLTNLDGSPEPVPDQTNAEGDSLHETSPGLERHSQSHKEEEEKGNLNKKILGKKSCKVTVGLVPDESSTEGESSNEESKSDKSITGSSQSPGDTASGSECNSLLAKDLAGFKCEVCGRICRRRYGFKKHVKSHEGKGEKGNLNEQILGKRSCKDLSKTDSKQGNSNQQMPGRKLSVGLLKKDPKPVLVPIVPMKSVCLKGQVPSKDKVTDGHVPDESSTEGENSNEESKSDKSITGSSQSPGDTASGSECNSLLAKDLAKLKCEVCGRICRTSFGLERHIQSHEGEEEKVMQAASTSNKQSGCKKECVSCGKVMLSKNFHRHDCQKKTNLKRAAEEAVDDVVPKKTKEEKTIIVPKRQYLRCLSINQSELKPLVRKDSWNDFLNLFKRNSYRLTVDDFSSDSEEDIEVEEYDEPEYEKDIATVRKNLGAISTLPVENSDAFCCVKKFVDSKVMPASKQQTIANISRLLGIVKFNAQETEQDSDLFESSLNIDYFEAGILKMEKAGAMPSTIIKNVADYRYVPAAYEIRFDDPGVPSGELFTKKINRLKNTLDTIISKYEKKNVVLIEEHKKKLAKEAERVDMGAVLSFGSDKEVTDIINKTLDDLENCENLDTARHHGRRDVLKKVHQVSCYIASCLIVSGTRPNGLQRFSNNNFEKAEYDIAKKMYHFRLTEQKTSGVGGAAPLSANEQLMSVMKTYYEIKVQVFPNSTIFLLNNQGNPLTYIQVFQSINKYLKDKNLPTITTSILRVAYETTSQNALEPEDRKLLSSVLAHNSEQVITKHYVADTIEGQSKAQLSLLKIQGIMLLKQDLIKSPHHYQNISKEEDVVKKFIERKIEHEKYKEVLLPIESKVINTIKQLRHQQK